MITATDENHLKETYALQRDHGHVTTSMLAERIGASAATIASSMPIS